MLEQPRRLIISILCGNEFINIAAAANMAAILLALYGEAEAGLINLMVMVPLLLLVGEVTPKTIAISDPARIATRVVAAPMSLWVRLITPLRWAIRFVADRLTTLVVGGEKSPANLLVADEIRLLVAELEEHGELRVEERALADSFLAAGDTEVVEIMTPRTRMTFIGEKSTVPHALERFRATREVRLPVYRGHHDTLLGFLHAEDLMQLVLNGVDLDAAALADLLHPVVAVPPTKKLDEMLEYFRDHDVSAAVVLNEFGGVEGMVTLRMVLHVMFRPVSTAAEREALQEAEEPGAYDVPGDMKLADFNLLTNFSLSDGYSRIGYSRDTIRISESGGTTTEPSPTR